MTVPAPGGLPSAVFVASVRAALLRELATLRRELAYYIDERMLYYPFPSTPNPTGVVIQHICGNLQHFLGAGLADTGYVRDREAEFQYQRLSIAELRALIDAATDAVERGLDPTRALDLATPFPLPMGHDRLTTGDMLLQLVAHTAFHLGQVDVQRRIRTDRAEGAQAVSPSALPSAHRA